MQKCMALGNPGFKRQRAEEGSRIFRRSLYFVKDLKKGHVINYNDVRRIRPETDFHQNIWKK